MSCPAPQAFIDFASGALDGDSIMRFHGHLDECAACLHVLAEVVRSGGNGHVVPYPARYRVLEECGMGGQARVLRGFDTVTSREVALKEPLARGSGKPGPDAHARFLREARITARLTHPGIVPVFDIGEREDGQPFYAMQFVRGRTLSEAIRAGGSLAGRLPLLSHFLELCQAVSFAHHRGVVHRDIKPQNVVVGEFGQTVLLDWGLAKVRGESRPREVVEEDDPAAGGPASVTRHGTVLGTPGYMSPEQAAGRLDEVDERSDVFGLGAVLYELMTGTPPVHGERRVPIVPVSSRCPHAPRELAVIASKALALERSERYERAADLAADVQAYLTGGRVRAYAYSAWELLVRLVSSHRRAAAAIGASLLALVVALGALATALGSAERRRLQALRSEGAELVEGALAASLDGDPLVARAKLRAGLEVADSLEGRALWWQLRATPLRWRLFIGDELHGVAVSPSARLAAVVGTRPGLRLVDLDTKDVRVALLGEHDSLMSVSFTGDGETLAIGAISGKARLLDMTTMATRELPGIVGPIWQVRISADGSVLFATDDHGTLWRWDTAAEGGPPVALPVTPRAEVWDLAARPDGAWVAATTADGTVSLVEVAARREVHLRCDPRAGSGVAFSPDGKWIAVSNNLDVICLWPVATADRSPPLRIAGPAGRMAFSPNGRQLAGSWSDGKLRIWDVASGELRRTLWEGDTTYARWPAWTGDGRELAVIFLDGTVKLFAAGGAAPPGAPSERTETPGAIWAVGVSPDGSTIAAGSGNGSLALLDPISGVETLRLANVHRSGVGTVRFSHDGGRLLTTGADGAARLWEVPSITLMKTLTGQTHFVTEGRFSNDGRFVGAAEVSGLSLWDAETGGLRHRLPAPGNWAFADREPLVVVGSSRDGSLGFWDVDRGVLVERVELPASAIHGVAFLDDDRQVAAATSDGKFLIWNRATRAIREVAAGKDLLAVTFEPGAMRVASTHEGEPLHVTDLESGQVDLVGPPNGQSATFTPDGRGLVVGTASGTVQVWDLASGRPRWRGPLLRSRVDEVFTHEGWRDTTGRALSPERAGVGWRGAVAREARLAAESPGAVLVCVVRFDDGLEVWTAGGETAATRMPLTRVAAVVAEDDACLALADGAVVRVTPQGARADLAAGATAFAVGAHGLLVAVGDELRVIERDGRTVARHRVGGDVTAIGELAPDLVALGFEHGGVEVWRLGKAAARVRRIRDAPQDAVAKLVRGPPGVLAAAFVDGTVGLWSIASGARLHAAWLHGTATHLRMAGHHLLVLTEVGRTRDWDLEAFFLPTCAILRDVWADVSVVWESGTAVRRAPSRGHECAP